MGYQIKNVKMEDEFKVCPSCGYKDGFHSMFKKEDGITKWLFVFPSCHEVFNIDFTVQYNFLFTIYVINKNWLQVALNGKVFVFHYAVYASINLRICPYF